MEVRQIGSLMYQLWEYKLLQSFCRAIWRNFYEEFMLMYGRNQHNIVKQLSSDLKKKQLTNRCIDPLNLCFIISSI